MHTKYVEQGARGLGLGNAGIVRHFKGASKERNGEVYVVYYWGVTFFLLQKLMVVKQLPSQ